ncbi:uncharacterized protein BDR25DRAFT_57438 [Lindgomyces ingoldianus]|uniref:Uncharacterized protein n=1 Tax=Lindgomyces ingoldianus TaxID=673940 RepID=A0ACB6QPQ1_9PLEO|nr:uncharacterized protein BDR25DRAFT_57438 [Lindgomyces ingoldianus]KAF2468082.1 hypothetical protein BDR25DRAFT_57438 [Lindgomyces ingoldianus]
MMESQRDVTGKGKQRSAPQAVPVHQDFLFVDASKTAKSSRQGRRNARSFVMQKARRERPWSTSKHAAKHRKSPETASPATVGTPELVHTPNSSTPSPPRIQYGVEYPPLTGLSTFSIVKQQVCSDCQILLCRPGQTLCPRCLLLQPPVPPEDLDNNLFDPFGSFPIEMDESVSELLDHFVSKMAPGTIAVDIRHKSDLMRSDWFGTAMSNPGFMHSLLCTAALHSYIVGRGSIETILYHKAQAIAAINSAISNPDPELGISDANIGAVFNLLCVEESLLLPFFQQEGADEDQPNQREIHLNGLRRMVQLRGGLKAINSNRILQAFILWHSTAHAIASFEAPYLSTADYISTAYFPHHPPGYRPNISNHLLDYCRKAQVRESLTELVESALVLIADLNVWFGDPDSPLDPLDIQNFSCGLECLLLKWLHDNENQLCPLEDGLCVALLIFTVRTTEALQRRSDIHLLHIVASKRLEKALSATSRYEWTPCPDLLLWILAIGAISAEGSPECSWFVYQVSLACEEFGIFSAETLLGRLHLCGWVSFKLGEAVHSLWDRIVNLRLEPFPDTSNIGPLQYQVSEPNFSDWQSIDWMDLSNQGHIPGESALGGEDGLYDLGVSYVLRRNQPFYRR